MLRAPRAGLVVLGRWVVEPDVPELDGTLYPEQNGRVQCVVSFFGPSLDPYFGGAGGIPGVSRAMGFPQVGIDGRTGTLFVTWSDFRNGDVDVFCAVSTDHGKKWSRAVRVNDDPVHDGNDQFFQWLAGWGPWGLFALSFVESLGISLNLAPRWRTSPPAP